MIRSDEYARRRKQLMRMAGDDAIIIIQAAPARIRNNDVHYPYRQDSDFLYLTGFREPDALLAMIPDANEGGGRCILFCREKDPLKEMWDGAMAGLDGALADYGMDEAFDHKQIEQRLPELLHDRDRIYYDLGREPKFDQRLIGWLNSFRETPRKTFHAPEEIHALDHMLHDMRLYKSRAELSAMKRSARVAIEAHEQAMQTCRPGHNEAEIYAGLLHTFARHQCEPSYLPIVGGGANSCVLHYIENNDELNDGELLLIDAGAEYDGYASDITRTFPINGKFSGTQRALYEVVLETQAVAIDAVVAGNQWEDVHEVAVRRATEGMVELGILQGSVTDALEQQAYERLYVHKTGHWLGLDVHDVGEYVIDGHSRELEPGMVLTVEPGIYISPQNTDVDAKWRGLGIRIEDNVVVTKGEALVLTDALVKTADDIEQLMAG